MKFFSIVFFLWIVSLEISASELKANDIIFPKLDQKIIWLFEKKPSAEDVTKKFGKPQLEKDNILHFELDNFKYSLILKYEKKQLISISYRLPEETEIDIVQFKKIIDANLFYHYPNSGHEMGKYYAADLKQENLKLVFTNGTEKKLQYLIYEKQK